MASVLLPNATIAAPWVRAGQYRDFQATAWLRTRRRQDRQMEYLPTHLRP